MTTARPTHALHLRLVAVLACFAVLYSMGAAQGIARLILSPSLIVGGSLSHGVIGLDAPAGPGGVQVVFSGAGVGASAPPPLSIPEGQCEGSFVVRTQYTSAPAVFTLTAQLGVATAAADLRISPYNQADMRLALELLGTYVMGLYDLGTGGYEEIYPYSGANQNPDDKSPRSSLMAYTSYITGEWQVWIIDLQTHIWRQITFDGSNWLGRFSPDGSKLIYVHTDGGWLGPNGVVRCYDLETGVTTVLMDRIWEDASYADWLPDGSGFVYVRDGYPGRLYRQEFGGSPTYIGSANYFGQLKVSPDGRRAVFHSNDFGNWRVQEIDLETGAISPGPEYGLGGLTYAPNGSIYFSVGTIYRYDPYSTSVVPVLSPGGHKPVVFEKGALAGISLTLSEVIGGQDVGGTVFLDSPAPAAGREIEIYTTSQDVATPQMVMVPPGQRSAEFVVQTSATNSDFTATIVAARGAVRHTAPLLVQRMPLTFVGFFEPINDPAEPEMSIFKRNRTVPVKFALLDNLGVPVETVATISLALVGTTEVPVNESAFVTPADSGIYFRYSDGQYIYNLGTRNLVKGAVYRITATIPLTGQTHSVLIGIN